MSELLQFKVYPLIGGRQQEVRRFSCDDNIDIGTLNTNIKEKFPNLGDKEFVIKWEDEEGDKVDISSEQELMLAMKEMKKIGSVYKLYMQIVENPWWKQVENNSDKGSKNCSGEEHPGIICFCCHQQVKGFRYKCVICPQYDMCGSCEERAMHPAHDMVRIPSPRSYPPHFFLRLHRLYERCTHSSPTVAKSGCGPISSPNEQMAKDLLEDDSSDISDLELEFSLVPEGSISSGPNRKRVNSGPGSCPNVAEKLSPLSNNAENCCLLQEQLPSFEELTKSMQDLAEKDLDENFENTYHGKIEILNKLDAKTCEKTRNEDLTKSRILNHNKIHLQQNSCFLTDKSKQKPGSATLDNAEIVNTQKLQDISKSKSHTNTNEEELIDTSESLRNIQQEIESLLAPLTPLPDLEPVPKVVKTGNDKEMFVLMNNRNKVVDNEKIRAGSFEIIENNAEQFCIYKSMEDWSLLGGKQAIDNQNEGKKVALTEETGNESSETETEDHVDSDDDCNGNINVNNQNEKEKSLSECQSEKNLFKEIRDIDDFKEDENINDNNQNDKEKALSECQSEKNLFKEIRDIDDFKEDGNINDNNQNDKEKSLSECQSEKNLFKEIGDIDDSNLASSKNVAESTDKVDVNNTIKDSQKHTENSEISSSFMTGELSGLGGQSSKGRRSPSQLGESYTEDKSEYKSATQPTKSSTSGARRHFNPRIADALDNMVGMGFTDDDGWLTQLLVMKRGDISQVLDILTPVKK